MKNFEPSTPEAVFNFHQNQKVLVVPNSRHDQVVPFEGVITELYGEIEGVPQIIHVKSPDDDQEKQWARDNVWPLKIPRTKDPIRYNHHPDEAEINARRAIHVLCDFSDDLDVILMADDRLDIYLVCSIMSKESVDDFDVEDLHELRPPGTVEYQVSDGLPNHRGTSHNFYNLKDAVAFFKEVAKDGGWKHWEAKADAEAT